MLFNLIAYRMKHHDKCSGRHITPLRMDSKLGIGYSCQKGHLAVKVNAPNNLNQG